MPKSSIEYRVIRSRRKTAAIHVGDKGVEVRVPHHVDDAWIAHWVQQKQRWIRSKLNTHQERQQTRVRLAAGEPVLFLGQAIPVVVEAALKSRVLFDGQTFEVSLNHGTALEDAMSHWFKQQARLYMTPRTIEIAERLGVSEQLNQVRFRRTKSKWGHCTQRGVIQYNWQIMGAPKAVIDYLICHEVSHLIHANHSKAFWHTVESLDQNYLQHEHWLTQNGHRLSWQLD